MAHVSILNSETWAQFYYNPYQQQQMNQQAYEMGARIMKQQMEAYNNNPANAIAITGGALQTIGTAYIYNNTQQLYNKAFGQLEHVADDFGFANAAYWLGVFSECELVGWVDVSDAKSYYEDAAEKGHAAAKKRLNQLNKGAEPYELDEVLTSLRQMLVATTMPSSFMSGSSSSMTGSSSSSSAYTTCRICGGTGICTTCGGKKGQWMDTGYYTGSGNQSWIECASCHGTTRCFNCHGTGRQ